MTTSTTTPRASLTSTGGLVGGTKVGFGSHPAGDRMADATPLPGSIADKVPAGPLRYRTGDPLATITFDGARQGKAPVTVEAYTQWKNRDDLIAVENSLRGALKVAFNRSKGEQAQAILQAKDGSKQYWIAALATIDQKELHIDGRDLKNVAVTGAPEEADLLAIVGKDAVLNFSDENVKKPHWWDPFIGS
jgi:hypothetical protein